MTIEGEVSKPLDLKPFTTLWSGTKSLDTTLGVLNSFVQLQLIEELQSVKRLAKASSRDAQLAMAALASLKLSIDMNLTQKLAITVSSLETEVLDL